MERKTYFQQVLKSLKRYKKIMTRSDSKKIESLCSQISKNGQFFRLPTNGVKTTGFDANALIFTKPPFPVTVIEYDVTPDPNLDTLTLTSVPRRIIIAVDNDPEIHLFGFWFFECRNIWMPVGIGCIIPISFQGPEIPFKLSPFCDGVANALDYNDMEGVKRDWIDELSVYVGFIYYLNERRDSFVKSGEVHSRNQKQRLPGSKATYQYHVLSVRNPVVSERGKEGGTHASPIRHLRRGHWRKTPSGGRTWIEAMMVGKEGFQDKDYRIV